jgi:hypothetical protein
MANFVFDEGAALALGSGLDWVATDYNVSVYDDTVAPQQSNTWIEINSGIVATLPLTNKSISTFSAASADGVEFVDVSPTIVGARFAGLLIHRNSDNLLIVHIDEGFDNLGTGGILGQELEAVQITFSVIPGLNNEAAWFRL